MVIANDMHDSEGLNYPPPFICWNPSLGVTVQEDGTHKEARVREDGLIHSTGFLRKPRSSLPILVWTGPGEDTVVYKRIEEFIRI